MGSGSASENSTPLKLSDAMLRYQLHAEKQRHDIERNAGEISHLEKTALGVRQQIIKQLQVMQGGNVQNSSLYKSENISWSSKIDGGKAQFNALRSSFQKGIHDLSELRDMLIALLASGRESEVQNSFKDTIHAWEMISKDFLHIRKELIGCVRCFLKFICQPGLGTNFHFSGI